MKFIASKTILLAALNVAGKAVSNNTVLPILENFLFDISDGKLTVSASDLQSTISTHIEVETMATGKIAVPSWMFIETLKTLPEQPITFSAAADTFLITLTAGDGNYKLSGQDGEDFPKIPAVEHTGSVVLQSGVLADAVGKTLFAVSTDELRPAMTGVYCKLTTGDITFVSTDAHKLVSHRISGVGATNDSSFIIPRKTAALLKSVLPSADVPVSVSYNVSNASFVFGEITVICRLIDERYPDYEAILPKNNNNVVILDRLAFLGMLNRVAIYSNRSTHEVRLSITGKNLTITSSDVDFGNEAKDELICDHEGDNLVIGFNARYLTEMLKYIDTTEVQLQMTKPNRAALLCPRENKENEELVMLIMPVMLKDY